MCSFFIAEQYTTVCVYVCMCVYIYGHNFYIHSSVNGYLDCFHFLTMVKCVAMNIRYMLFFQFWFSQGICRIVKLLGHMVVLFLVFFSFFFFFRNLYTVLHSDSINSHYWHQCKRIPFPPHSLQHLFLVHFKMMTILTGVSWCLIVVWFESFQQWVILRIFSCVCLAMYTSLEKYLSRSFTHFLY